MYTQSYAKPAALLSVVKSSPDITCSSFYILIFVSSPKQDVDFYLAIFWWRMTNQRKIRLFHPLIVFPYDCNVLRSWLWVDPWVRLCLDLFGMQPLLQQPRPHSQSGLRFEALQISELSLHWPSGFLQSWCVKVSWDIFWTAYMPRMEFLPFEKISCYITPKLPLLINWCTLGFQNVVLSLVSIRAAALLFLCCDVIALACVDQNMKAETYDINISPISEAGEGQNRIS